MDEQRKPRSREKHVVESGKGVERKGEALGNGPVNNTGNYAGRQDQIRQTFSQTARSSGSSAHSGNPAESFSKATGKPGNTGRSGSSEKTGSSGITGTPRNPSGSQPVSGFPRSGKTGFSSGSNAGGTRKTHTTPSSYKASQNGSAPGSTRASGSTSGGGGKLIMIILAAIVLLGGGRLSGLFSDNGSSSGTTSVTNQTAVTTGTGSGTTGTVSAENEATSQADNQLSNLLSALLSGSSSIYETTSAVSVTENNQDHYFTSSSQQNTQKPDNTVAVGSREKYTQILGNKKDTVTILVYMCGTDLESKSGMGTADLKEMASASLNDHINLIVYTGGCSKWKNNVVSNAAHQIYQIRDGGLYCLEKNMGSASMTSPETLAKFIQYGTQKFPANRMCLIFWDHGGGSVSGFGYDELNKQMGSMSLAGIQSALKKGGTKFDFIGFDACLMGTVENGLMLSEFADYLIGSEETEPGVGWYYTNWLNKLSQNPSIPTVSLGQMIADDFVQVCNQKCRGQATTLSVVDLAELSATVPEALKAFSLATSGMIQNNQYQVVAKARNNTREFAQSSRIDQIDLIHFARNMKTAEGNQLASALEGAVKYNRTGGSVSNAFGLSVYFPCKNTRKVTQMVSTYESLGLEEYTRCIQEFASLELSGQSAASVSFGSSYSGTGFGSLNGSNGMLNALFGGGEYTQAYSSQDELTGLLGGLFGGSSSNDLFSLFSNRNITADTAADYIWSHHFDPTQLVWVNGKIQLSSEQWQYVEDLAINVFFADGDGYIDLGTDNVFTLEGNNLVSDFDGTWISVDRQPVAYYYMSTAEENDQYVICGYVPALLNGNRVNLLLQFDSERPEGYIAGAMTVYDSQTADVQAKNLIGIGEGDVLQFLCDYYDSEGNYQSSYHLGDPITLGQTVEIANTPIDPSRARVTYCFTDLYQQQYWTPVAP